EIPRGTPRGVLDRLRPRELSRVRPLAPAPVRRGPLRVTGREAPRGRRGSFIVSARKSRDTTTDLDEQLGIITEQVSRAPMATQLQMLLGTEIAVGLFQNDQVQKLRHIFEAYFALPVETRREIVPDAKEQTNMRMGYAI